MQNRFPPGWDEERVRRVLAHYEEQNEAEAVAEDEAAFEEPGQTVMEVPEYTFSLSPHTFEDGTNTDKFTLKTSQIVGGIALHF